MKQQELVRILLSPVISEKSTLLSEEEKKFVFKVKKNASKKNIKQAVELMFEVKVDYVHVLNVKGKTKRYGRFMGSRSDWKKAYVKLKPGFNIDLAVA
ncbi:MAG: 50S ribosomal protein L23 [Proteobacteria bacterium]|nr:50S ribosomal protein L23 [Pseudomonadota bacterium]